MTSDRYSTHTMYTLGCLAVKARQHQNCQYISVTLSCHVRNAILSVFFWIKRKKGPFHGDGLSNQRS